MSRDINNMSYFCQETFKRVRYSSNLRRCNKAGNNTYTDEKGSG